MSAAAPARSRARSPRLVLGALLALPVLAGPAVGVGAAQEGGDIDVVAVDSTGHPEVVLTVEPPAELADTELSADHFTVAENGAVLDVSAARVGSGPDAAEEAPRVALVVDRSGSMRGEPMDAARAAARAFLGEMPEGTEVAVVAFGDAPEVLSPMSDDRGAASATVGGIEAGGETALYDAVAVALRQLGDGGAGAARDAIVLMSDGGDTTSRVTLDEVVGAIRRSGTRFAAVELVSGEHDGAGLRALAGAAGGTVLSADEPARLSGLFEDVAADLLNRYRLTYETAAGGVTEVEVAVTADGVSASTTRQVRLPEPAPAAAVDAPVATTFPEPGWLGSRAALVTGLGLLFLAFAIVLGRALVTEREVRVDLGDPRRLGRTRVTARMPALDQLAGRLTGAAERRLARSGRGRALDARLERAGVDLRPGELVALAAASSLAALAVGWLLGGVALAVVLAVATGAAPPVLLRWKAANRRTRFADQLADTLALLTGSLRAGHSTLQSMDSVASDAPSPTREEFQRLVTEVRLGRDLPAALWAMHERIGNQDFAWVVQAVEIHREVGGDLSEIFDTVADTVRERTHVRRQVRALSAEGRVSAAVLFALPFVMALAVSVLNPGYLSPLLDTTLGMALVAAGSVMLAVGFLWLRKLVRIEM